MNHQKQFVIWSHKLDTVFEGDTRQQCVDQLLLALRAAGVVWPLVQIGRLAA